MRTPIDITGQKFGELTAVRFSHRPKIGVHHWLFRCDCGNEVTVWKPDVIRGRRIDCGAEEAPESKFWKNIKKTSGCWLWTGSTSRGYGTMSVDGKNMYAHRFSYELHHKRVPREMCVLHVCDNPPCVNPDHLWIGTKKDNAIDRNRKGRAYDTSGENNGRYIDGRTLALIVNQ